MRLKFITLLVLTGCFFSTSAIINQPPLNQELVTQEVLSQVIQLALAKKTPQEIQKKFSFLSLQDIGRIVNTATACIGIVVPIVEKEALDSSFQLIKTVIDEINTGKTTQEIHEKILLSRQGGAPTFQEIEIIVKNIKNLAELNEQERLEHFALQNIIQNNANHEHLDSIIAKHQELQKSTLSFQEKFQQLKTYAEELPSENNIKLKHKRQEKLKEAALENFLNQNVHKENFPLIIEKFKEINSADLTFEQKFQEMTKFCKQVNEESEIEHQKKEALNKILAYGGNSAKMIQYLQELKKQGVSNLDKQIEELSEYDKNVNVLEFLKKVQHPKDKLDSLIGKPPSDIETVVDIIKNPTEYYIPKDAIGVLLHGKPGTGKTAYIKAIAAETDTGLFQLKLGEILNKYHGETEKLIPAFCKAVVKHAQEHGRAMLFIDELDSIGTKRSNSDSNIDGRVLTTLLDELSNLPNNVYLFAATNNFEALDEALIRYGRFGFHTEVKLPEKDMRLELAKGFAKEFFKNYDHVDLNHLANNTDNFSPADMKLLFFRVSTECSKNRREPTDEDFKEAIVKHEDDKTLAEILKKQKEIKRRG